MKAGGIVRVALAVLVSGVAGTSLAATNKAAECPRPFVGKFSVEWHGLNAGTSTLELIRHNATEYTYKSSNSARGIFKLAIPDTITQTSDFTIVDGGVRPSMYVGDDGSSDTSRDVSLKFDWAAHRVAGTAENKPVDLPLVDGVQDGLSVQIALMCELARGHAPESFKLIDKDEIKEYQYTREGEARLDTAIGPLDTVIYKSQKAGASRYTRLWIAPSLGYLPVRAEQAKADKRELQLQILSLERPAKN